MEKGWVKGDLDGKKEGLNKRPLLLSTGMSGASANLLLRGAWFTRAVRLAHKTALR